MFATQASNMRPAGQNWPVRGSNVAHGMKIPKEENKNEEGREKRGWGGEEEGDGKDEKQEDEHKNEKEEEFSQILNEIQKL